MATATISNMVLVHGGYWLARVDDGTDFIYADNRIGPWTTPVDPDADHSSNKISRRELVPEVSAKLRELVRAGGGDAVISFTPAHRPTTIPVHTPARPKSTTEMIAQRMAEAGAAAIGKAA